MCIAGTHRCRSAISHVFDLKKILSPRNWRENVSLKVIMLDLSVAMLQYHRTAFVHRLKFFIRTAHIGSYRFELLNLFQISAFELTIIWCVIWVLNKIKTYITYVTEFGYLN